MSTSSPQPQATLTIDFGNGFANGPNELSFNDAVLFSQLPNLTISAVGKTHSVEVVYFTKQQDITRFKTNFKFHIPNAQPGLEIAGLCFIIQNSNATTNSSGNFGGVKAAADANGFGYGAFASLGGGQQPIGNSVAVYFDLGCSGQGTYPVTAKGNYSTVGLAVNGGTDLAQGFLPTNDLNPAGIDLHSGHVFSCSLWYDGGLLTMVLEDTVTSAQYRTSWPVDIPACVQGNLAWVGFGGANVVPTLGQDIELSSWQFFEGNDPVLTPPVFSVPPGQYASTQTVSLSAPAGSSIFYTVNGLPPTIVSKLYTGPITVRSTQYIQAIAAKAGCMDSPVAVGAYQIGSARQIDLGAGFAVGDGVILCGNAVRSGSTLQLTDTANQDETGAVWWGVPVDIHAGFSTTFGLKFTSAKANGLCFVLQNYNSNPAAGYTQTYGTGQLHVTGGPTAVGNNQPGLGYGAIQNKPGFAGLYNSVALAFDLFTVANSVGLYRNGAEPVGNQVPITAVNIAIGNELIVVLTYAGTTLSLTLTDTVTKAVFTHSWSVDVVSCIGQNRAYPGFTASTGGLTANMFLTHWEMSVSTPNPVFTPLVKGFSFTIATTDTAGNPLPTGEAESTATIGIRADGDTTHGPGNYQFVVPLAGGVSSVTPAQLTAALGKPLAPGNYWAAVDQTDTLNGTTATSAFTAEVPFSILQPVVQPSSPTGFTAA